MNKATNRKTHRHEATWASDTVVIWPAPPVHPCNLGKWAISPADASQAPVEIWDDGSEPLATFPSVEGALAAAGDQDCGEIWLWCLHCHRFFQAKHLELDFLDNWQRCPYDDCQAAGFDIDIYHWSNGKTETCWPESERDLRVGLQYPPCRCPQCTAARRDAVFAGECQSST